MQQERFLPIHRVSLSEIDPSVSDNLRWENWVHKRIDLLWQIKKANTEAVLEALRRKAVRRNGRNGKER